MKIKLDDIMVNDNREFVRCDNKDCEERGQYPECYFDIYQKCDHYSETSETERFK